MLECKFSPVPYRDMAFVFEFRGEGRGSGGPFAWGEYSRAHEAYMRELGVWDQCQYRGFSAEDLQAFRNLAHDLLFAKDFLVSSADVLLSAAVRESVAKAERSEQLYAGYVGDTRNIEKMRALFKEGRYSEVVAIFDKLQAPHLLSDAQLRLVELARGRSRG